MSQTAMFLQDIGSAGNAAKDAGTRAVGSPSKGGGFEAVFRKKIIHAQTERTDASRPERGTRSARSEDPKSGRSDCRRRSDRDASPVLHRVQPSAADGSIAASGGPTLELHEPAAAPAATTAPPDGGVQQVPGPGEVQPQGGANPPATVPVPETGAAGIGAQAGSQGTPGAESGGGTGLPSTPQAEGQASGTPDATAPNASATGASFGGTAGTESTGSFSAEVSEPGAAPQAGTAPAPSEQGGTAGGISSGAEVRGEQAPSLAPGVQTGSAEPQADPTAGEAQAALQSDQAPHGAERSEGEGGISSFRAGPQETAGSVRGADTPGIAGVQAGETAAGPSSEANPDAGGSAPSDAVKAHTGTEEAQPQPRGGPGTELPAAGETTSVRDGAEPLRGAVVVAGLKVEVLPLDEEGRSSEAKPEAGAPRTGAAESMKPPAARPVPPQNAGDGKAAPGPLAGSRAPASAEGLLGPATTGENTGESAGTVGPKLPTATTTVEGTPSTPSGELVGPQTASAPEAASSTAPNGATVASAATAVTPDAAGATGGTESGTAAANHEEPFLARYGVRGEEILGQIVRNAKLHLGAHAQRFEMRLEPPQLGRLLVSLTVRDGVVTAAFRAENAEIRDLLQASLPQLREALTEEGVTVGRFETATRGDDGTDSNAAPGSDGTPFGRRRFGGAPRGVRRMRVDGGAVGTGAASSVPGAMGAPRMGAHGIDILA